MGFIIGILLGIVLSFMVGPVFFALIETSLTKGIRSAVLLDIGVILADVFFISIAYFGSVQLINRINGNPLLFVFGGTLMAAYGLIDFLRSKRAKPEEFHVACPSDTQRDIGLITKGFFLNFLNVGVLGFWFALLIAVGPVFDMNPTKLLCFFTLVIASYFLTDLLKISLAKRVRRKLTTENIRNVKRINSLILVVFGVVVIAKSTVTADPFNFLVLLSGMLH